MRNFSFHSGDSLPPHGDSDPGDGRQNVLYLGDEVIPNVTLAKEPGLNFQVFNP